MGKTSQRKRSMFEQGIDDARNYGRGLYRQRGRKDLLGAYNNGVKAGLSKLTPSYSPDYADGADYGAIAFESEINEGLWTGLKRLALLAALVLAFLALAACSLHTITITPGCVNATSTALFYCPEATVIRVADGNRTVDMLGEASGVGAVVQGLGNNAVEVMR